MRALTTRQTVVGCVFTVALAMPGFAQETPKALKSLVRLVEADGANETWSTTASPGLVVPLQLRVLEAAPEASRQAELSVTQFNAQAPAVAAVPATIRLAGTITGVGGRRVMLTLDAARWVDVEAILDTSIYIDHWEQGLHAQAFDEVRQAYVVRHSSVVLSELRRGARTADARRLVDRLFQLARVQWAPTTDDWWAAGDLVRRIGDAQTWDQHKRNAFQNDALIGLTARRQGAAVVTANREDFELLARHCRIELYRLS